jgi:hypothetical protein
MKNSIRLIIMAVILAVAVSCENKPSTLNYTLTGNFYYVAKNSTEYPTVDSLYYNKYLMLDNYSSLCTSCDDANTGFNGGWKVSLKKGSESDTDELLMFTSAGKYAGYTDPDNNFTSKTYAVFSPSSSSSYDIVFKYGDYFSASSCRVLGFYINNTKYVEKLAEEGLIADGEYLKVTATFYLKDSAVCTEEFDLVDYTGSERKIVKDWTAWNMKTAKQHDVDAVKFSLSSVSLPQSFCLDILMASISVEY